MNFFINRESVISHRYRMSAISLDYRKYINLTHQQQINFESHLIDMTPAKYLRYLRDKGAKLFIVSDTYITYYFEDSKLLDNHLKELNNKMLKMLTKVK